MLCVPCWRKESTHGGPVRSAAQLVSNGQSVCPSHAPGGHLEWEALASLHEMPKRPPKPETVGTPV